MSRKDQKQAFTKVLILVAVVALALSLSLPDWGELRLAGGEDGGTPKTMQVKALGKTYGQWSVEWFQYIAAIPADQNPLFSEGEVDLSIGQQGHVWFLACSMVGPRMAASGTDMKVSMLLRKRASGK